MTTVIVRRLLQTIPALIGIYTLVFVLLHIMPGDPALIMLSEGSASAEHLDRLRQQLGLDRPIHEQYLNYLSDLLRGDLGRSIRMNRPVAELILEFLPYTLKLTLVGLGLACILGVVFGTLAAVYQNTWVDTAGMILAISGVSMPGFWLGLLLIFLFSLHFGWPVTGHEGWRALILPGFVLGVNSASSLTRLTRSSMLEVLRQDYMTTARAKGVGPLRVILRHGLSNALIPVLTIVGVEFGRMMMGAVIIEEVFARPGLGRLILQSILQKDFPALQSTILFVAVCYALVNLLVDLSYAYLDPRTRLAENV